MVQRGSSNSVPNLGSDRSRTERPAVSFLEFVRKSRCPIGALTIWQLPWSLFAKGQNQQLHQREFLLIPIRGDADSNFILRNVTSQGAMKFVPPTKNGSPVRVRFPLHDRMVDAMHARCDNDAVQQMFDSQREPPVRMMKERGGFEGDEKDEEHDWGDAEEHDGQREKSHREEHLAEMKSCGGAYVHIEVGVMDVVKTPEERQHVIDPMPPPIGIVHEQKCRNGGDPMGRREPVEQTNMSILRPHRRSQRDRQQRKPNNGEPRDRENEIADQPMQQAELLAAQRKTVLQPEQREKHAGQQRTADVIDERNFGHELT